MGTIRTTLSLSWLLFTLLLTLAGCGPKTTVVLLEDPDGGVGRLTVSNEQGQTEIAGIGEGTVINRGAPPSPAKTFTQAEIQKTFGPALSSLPAPPVHYILYFRSGSTKLTEESGAQLPEIIQTIQDRKSTSIGVIGHTDTTGNRNYNMKLSRQRAEAVRTLLQKQGVPGSSMSVTSHGEENPLVDTPDNVPEPKNRRVEVVIR